MKVYLIVDNDLGIKYLFERNSERRPNHAKMFFAGSSVEAEKIFNQEKCSLTHIFLAGRLLDGSSVNFARIVAEDSEFRGVAIAMSADPDLQEQLHRILGNKYRQHQLPKDQHMPKLKAIAIAFPTPPQLAVNPA